MAHERRLLSETQDREIYPNAPLQFVAFELRTPFAPDLATLEGTTGVYESLRDLVPIIQSPPAPTFEVTSPAPVAISTSAGPTRMVDRQRTLSVTVGANAIVVETSAYSRFEEFSAILRRVVEAVGASTELSGIQRVGLRYIDEIRAEGVSSAVDWEGYIQAPLLAAVHLEERFAPSTTQGLAEFDLGEGRKTVMRFGAMNGFVVDPAGPLRLRRREEGPFFLIDLDSFWLASEDETPEFSPDAVLATCSRLREPIRALFEASITEKLRAEVLRKEVR